MLVTAVTPAATAATVALGMVPPPTADRAVPPAALLVAQGLVRQVPARPPTAEARPTVGRVVQALAGLRAPAIAVRLVVVTVGQPRPVLARVVPVMLPAVLVTPRVTRAAVLAVPVAAAPVVMLRVPPERAEPPRVGPDLAGPRRAVTAVPVVLPTPVLVRPVRVA